MNGFVGVFKRLYQLLCQAFVWMAQAVYSFANLSETYQAPTDLPFSCPTSPQVRIQTATPRLSSDPEFVRRVHSGPPRQLHLPGRVSARQSLESLPSNSETLAATQSRRSVQPPFLKRKASSISVPSIRREPTGSSAGTPNTGFLSPTFSAQRTSTTSLSSIESVALSQHSSPRHKSSLSDGVAVNPVHHQANEPPTIELGGLAKRRGFKGSPLLTSQISLGDSLRSLSPTSMSTRGSRAMSILSPRSSVEAVTNIIKNGKSVSQEKEPEVPPETQEAFTTADPFAVDANSFYEPSFESCELPKSTVRDLDVYVQAGAQEHTSRKKRMPSVRSHKASMMKDDVTTTTIYDLTMDDIPLRPDTSLRVPAPCAVLPSSGLSRPPRSPKILVTSPSAHSTSARTDNSTCSAEMNGTPSTEEATTSSPLCTPSASENEGEGLHQVTSTQEFAPTLPPTISLDENDDLLWGVLGKRGSQGASAVLRDVGNIAISNQSPSCKVIQGGNEVPLSKHHPVLSASGTISTETINRSDCKGQLLRDPRSGGTHVLLDENTRICVSAPSQAGSTKVA